MRLSIRHLTQYDYTTQQAYNIHQLHLTPRVEAQQHVLSWNISTPGQVHAYTDAYGNQSHMLTLNTPHAGLSIVACGLVETTAPPQGRLAGGDSLSPLIYTVSTRLTEPTPGILELAAACLPDGKARTKHLMLLAEHIFGAVRYQSGATDVFSTAGDALGLGHGVAGRAEHVGRTA